MKKCRLFLLVLLILPLFIECSKKDPVEPTPPAPVLEFSRYEVYQDDNDDQIPNRGETVKIYVYVKNVGLGTATKVGAFLSEIDPNVAVTVNQAAFGTINPGLEEQGSCTLEISDLCPYDYDVPCYLNIYDGEGRTWADTFSIAIEKTGADIHYSKYEVWYDDNSDGIPVRGETVKINLYLENRGASSAYGVEASLTDNDPYINITDSQGAFGGFFNPDEEKYSSYTFDIINTCPYNHVATFYIDMADDYNNTWQDSFTVTIPKTTADLHYTKYDVWYDDNSDGIPSRGETVKINVYLENRGTTSTYGVTAYLTENDPYINVTDSYGLYTKSSSDFFDPDEEKHDSYTFDVSGTCPYGHTVQFYMDITDDYNNTWQDSFTVTIMESDADMNYSRYEVFYDDNGDGIPSRGESVGINLYLENQGTSSAYGVEAYLTENDPYVNLTDSYGSFPGFFLSGEEKSSVYAFDISNTCPYGHVVTFNVNIGDDYNNSWQDAFTITILQTPANIEFNRYDINADDNADGKVNPGEYIKLLVYVQNTGTSKALGVAANLLESDPNVTMTTSYYYFGDLEAGMSQVGVYYFTVSASCPVPHTINFNLEISDSEDNEWLDSFTVPVE